MWAIMAGEELAAAFMFVGTRQSGGAADIDSAR
jgi:hypothetical protein